MERKIGYSSNTKTIFRDFLGFCSEKNPNPGDLGFFGILASGFFGGKKSQIPGIWELGSQKNPIPKPPLVNTPFIYKYILCPRVLTLFQPSEKAIRGDSRDSNIFLGKNNNKKLYILPMSDN